jgi:hypothetical protein
VALALLLLPVLIPHLLNALFLLALSILIPLRPRLILLTITILVILMNPVLLLRILITPVLLLVLLLLPVLILLLVLIVLLSIGRKDDSENQREYSRTNDCRFHMGYLYLPLSIGACRAQALCIVNFIESDKDSKKSLTLRPLREIYAVR